MTRQQCRLYFITQLCIQVPKMDYWYPSLVIFIVFYNRINCEPLLNEMTGTASDSASPDQKVLQKGTPRSATVLEPAPNLASATNDFISAIDSLFGNVNPSSPQSISGIGILDNPLIAQQLDALLGSKSVGLGNAAKSPPAPNNFMNTIDKSLVNAPMSSSKSDPGLGILDNPLIAQQIDALLGSKPANSVSQFSTFSNPAFEAQLNKMFGPLPLGSMTSLSFLNSPIAQTHQGKFKPQNQVNQIQNTNKLSMKVPDNLPPVTSGISPNKVGTAKAPLLRKKSNVQPQQDKHLSPLTPPSKVNSSPPQLKPLSSPPKRPLQPKPIPSSPQQPPSPPAQFSSQPNISLPSKIPSLPPSQFPPQQMKHSPFLLSSENFVESNEPMIPPAKFAASAPSSTKETDPLLMEAGVTDVISKPDTALSPILDKTRVKPVENTVPHTGTGNFLGGSHFNPFRGVNFPAKDPFSNLQLGPSLNGQLSTPGSGGVSNPASETMSGMAFGSKSMKQTSPQDEIGTILNEMSEMMHPQQPFGGTTLPLGTSSLGTAWSTNIGGMTKDAVSPGMSWLNAAETGMGKEMATVEQSLLPNLAVVPESQPDSTVATLPTLGGTSNILKSPPKRAWLKTDLGSLVGEAEQKKEKPKETVCTLKDTYAICNLVGNPSKPNYHNITGTLYLRQQVTKSCKHDRLNIQVDISNVPMNDGTLFHGLHIHEYGEMTNGCEGMGQHYNPLNTPHGAPWQPESFRHVGDLGNVRQRRRDGKIYTRIVDYVAQLDGPHSIIGRGIALKSGRDDLGQGGGDSSKITGNSGDTMACCVISRSRPHSDDLYTLY